MQARDLVRNSGKINGRRCCARLPLVHNNHNTKIILCWPDLYHISTNKHQYLRQLPLRGTKSAQTVVCADLVLGIQLRMDRLGSRCCLHSRHGSTANVLPERIKLTVPATRRGVWILTVLKERGISEGGRVGVD